MPMKKKIVLLSLLTLSLRAVVATPEKAMADVQVAPLHDQPYAALWASRVLTKLHYKPAPLDDLMSEKIFDRYFKSLDVEKLFFNQDDIDQYAPARIRLDDSINRGNL